MSIALSHTLVLHTIFSLTLLYPTLPDVSLPCHFHMISCYSRPASPMHQPTVATNTQSFSTMRRVHTPLSTLPYLRHRV